MADPGRVLVVAPNWLGDAVMSIPAVEDVRRRYAAARLVVAARPAVAPLFGMVRGVDEVVELEWRGHTRGLGAMRRDAVRLRAASADAALLLPNSLGTALLARMAAIPERWGYARDGRSALLSRAVARPPHSLHQGLYYQWLVRELGMASGPPEPSIDVAPDAVTAARALLAAAGWDGSRPLVVFAAGAAYGSAKRWPPEHFAALANALIADGATCVLIGSAADAGTASTVRSAMVPAARAHALDLAGKTTLPVLAGVLSCAAACVSNDSGAMHLAAAAGVPLVALFGPTNERETSPIGRPGVPAQVLVHPVSCRPCMLRECPIEHPCMRELDPMRVLEAVRRLQSSPRF
jgi:heptosyltransferase-2